MSNNLKQAQVFTPEKVTHEMIDLLNQGDLADPYTFFFEPSCGDGQMLVVIVERIYQELYKKYLDVDQTLADTLHKFYAIDLDAELIPKARMRIYEWAVTKLGREPSQLESTMIARSLQQSIEVRDFFEVMKLPDITSSGARSIARKSRKEKSA